MREVTIKVYSFSELEEKVQEKVKNNWEYEDSWYEDRVNSYKKAKDLYKLFNFDYNEKVKGVRLYTWIQNNILPKLRAYKLYSKFSIYYSKLNYSPKARFSRIQFEESPDVLTGVCYDHDFLAPIIDFLKNPTDDISAEDLYDTNLDRIFELVSESDYENWWDNFEEFADANEYEFTADGKVFYG